MDEPRLTSTWAQHRPGSEFTAPVWLDGWGDQSMWGWELDAYFVNLLPNGAPADMQPHMFGRVFPNISSIVAVTWRVTAANPVSVCEALEILPTQAAVMSDDEILSARSQAVGDHGYLAGQRAACDWLLGRLARSPGSGWSWPDGRRPDPAIVAAEAYINAGEIYLEPTSSHRAYRQGVDVVIGRMASTL